MGYMASEKPANFMLQVSTRNNIELSPLLLLYRTIADIMDGH